MIDHSAMRLGRAAHDPVVLSKALKLSSAIDDEVIPEPPVQAGFGRFMTSRPMLGNNKAGCCVFATCMHAIQAITASMGRERTFTEAECLRAYSAIEGYIPGDESTDNGANMYHVLTQWKLHPELFGDIELEGFASINLRNWRRVQQGLWLFGAVLCGFDLPLISQRQLRWQVEIGAGDDQVEPRGWGGHAVCGGERVFVPGGLPRLEVTTWGGPMDVTSGYGDAYGREGYIILLKGQEPVNAPGFDRDRLARAMKELSR